MICCMHIHKPELQFTVSFEVFLQFIFTAFFFRKNRRHTFGSILLPKQGVFSIFFHIPILQSIFTVFLSTFFIEIVLCNIILFCILFFYFLVPHRKLISEVQWGGKYF